MHTPIEIPSVSEAAIPGFEYATWFGFLAPAKVPAAIVDRLHRHFRRRRRLVCLLLAAAGEREARSDTGGGSFPSSHLGSRHTIHL